MPSEQVLRGLALPRSSPGTAIDKVVRKQKILQEDEPNKNTTGGRTQQKYYRRVNPTKILQEGELHI